MPEANLEMLGISELDYDPAQEKELVARWRRHRADAASSRDR
jgi:hypothetical protein